MSEREQLFFIFIFLLVLQYMVKGMEHNINQSVSTLDIWLPVLPTPSKPIHQ